MTQSTLRRPLAAAVLVVLGAAAARAADPPPAGDRSRAQERPVSGEYRLGAGDKLRIEVYRDEQLSQSVQVRPDGKITLPLVGDIEAAGRTPLELRDALTAALREYVTNPVVTVIVVEALASQVFVMGEVTRAGPVPLNGPTTILQALSMAGGFKEFAKTKDVRILRQTPRGIETIRFNYRDALNGEIEPLYLRAGDTVIVP